MQVLGVAADADSSKVEQAYKKKKRAAEQAGNKAELQRLEDAHNAIFMASLSSRLQVLFPPSPSWQ